ncbi:MAG: DNA-directed RNA polymerase subunit alpha [Armatimonadota bacterium]|nr:DNA-directed RNA polymerase subunit alpha [Armatimonadota bacterium]
MDMVTPSIEVIEETQTYGKFVIEPQERGFGSTLGNALRRVLLSSVTGAAITSIKIDGVLHEFSTIPGVKEDTTQLILNLRDINVKIESDGASAAEPRTMRVDVHGPGDVTGADIQVPSDVEIVNPEVHIATLNDESSRLTMEMTVEQGRGYVLPERQERVKQSIGVIPLGAIFTPVRKANYIVEPTRVGHKTDYDRLILEITTNGSIRPSDAVSEAAKILDKHLRLFFDFTRRPRGVMEDLDEEGQAFKTRAPDARIEELDFSVRTYNCLKKADVLTIGELVQLTEADLMNVRNFGKKSLNEVKDKLAQLGLSLRKGAEGSSVIISNGDDEEEMDIDMEETEESEETKETKEVEVSEVSEE